MEISRKNSYNPPVQLLSADTFAVEITPFKKADLASTVIVQAPNSLLFNKKNEFVKGSQQISNVSKGNLVCQSLAEEPQDSMAAEGCSSESPTVGNLAEENKDAKQEDNL
jgi:hypothetical protein